jgi:acetoin utilization deacetylase AcuC-like enzyme
MNLHSLANRARRWLHAMAVEVWYDHAYRLPLPGLEFATGFEPRRADFVAWYLKQSKALPDRSFKKPRRCTYEELARVHTPEFLDAIARPQELARVFSVDAGLLPVDELLHAIRLSVGGTIEASRSVLRGQGQRLGRRALNLLGGFHHAGRARAGGFCPVNDVAVAIAALRADGFTGRVSILDLDAHPPDGTAECLEKDDKAWLGSISGADWGPFPRAVDETVIEGAGDERYLEVLEGLLSRMPSDTRLCFVLAGGDVLKGDALGKLALSLDGVRQRDLRVSDKLLDVPSVWLPAGGYGVLAWQALAGTGLALALGTRSRIPKDYDPLGAQFAELALQIGRDELGGTNDLSMDDVAMDLGLRPEKNRLVLGFYTAEGLEHAFNRYGFLRELERLGYGQFRVEIGTLSPGDRLRLYGRDAAGHEGVLIETMVEKKVVAGVPVLYVHWLTLRHPAAQFSDKRPRLPGQEVPGLGMAREATELLTRMAHRLELKGVAYRPSSFHTAYAGRGQLWFVDAGRQGRFEALVELLKSMPLVEATKAVAEGRVLLNGAPYKWEADEMVRWIEAPPLDRAAVASEKERCRFELAPASHAAT